MENNAKKKNKKPLKKSPKFYIEERGDMAFVGWSPGIKAVSPTARIVMSSYEEAPVPPKEHKVPMLTSLCVTAKEMNWEIDERIRELERLKKAANKFFKEPWVPTPLPITSKKKGGPTG